MQLLSLYLRNFRNYAEAQIDFQPKLNLICGENGQGKTNLLEAIYLVATGRSFRTVHLQELIRFGESFFYLEAKYRKDSIEQTVKISFDGQTKRVQLDGSVYTSFNHLLGLLPTVLYAPEDAEWIVGSPALRRRLLNVHLAQSDPLYVHHLSRFWRAMKQRNCLLRMKEEKDLEVWETEMAQSAVYIYQQRGKMLEGLKEPLARFSEILSNRRETVELRYLPSFHPTQYLQQMKKNRVREMQLGLSSTGPHRDDLSLFLDGKPAKLFASEGQKRTAAAAIRLAEWEQLSQTMNGQALLGIDDFGLHLDLKRQEILSQELKNLGQVFITAPNIPDCLSAVEGLHKIEVMQEV